MTATPTLVYDADCAFCTSCAEFAAARSTYAVTPWQALDLPSVGLTVEDVTTAAYWLPTTGTPLRGARGIAAALREMGPAYRMLGVVVDLPPVRPIAALVYALVARNRHRLPGGSATCKMP